MTDTAHQEAIEQASKFWLFSSTIRAVVTLGVMAVAQAVWNIDVEQAETMKGVVKMVVDNAAELGIAAWAGYATYKGIKGRKKAVQPIHFIKGKQP